MGRQGSHALKVKNRFNQKRRTQGVPTTVQLMRARHKDHSVLLKRGSCGFPDSSCGMRKPSSLGLKQVLLNKYATAMNVASEKGLMSGCASVALRHGELVHAQSFGYADLEARTPFRLDTICRIFCMTKTYVIVAFMMLVEEGRVHLEDPVATFLPAFKDIKVVGMRSREEARPSLLCKPKRTMRMSHLLTHTSGLSYGTGFGEEPSDATEESYSQLVKDVDNGRISDLAEFTTRLAKIPLRFHPGDQYEYSFSTDVLGRVLEVITGQSLEACLHQRLFAPLGMHDTSFSVPSEKLDRFAACYGGAAAWGKLYGKVHGSVPCTSLPGLVRVDGDRIEDSAWCKGRECKVRSGGGIMGQFQGGLVSTVADTYQFVRMLAKKGIASNGQRLLKEETVAAMEAERKDPGLAGEVRQNLLGGLQGLSGEEFGTGGVACTYWSVDRKADNAIVWFTQHIEMPEWKDQSLVKAEDADLWAVMYNAICDSEQKP